MWNIYFSNKEKRKERGRFFFNATRGDCLLFLFHYGNVCDWKFVSRATTTTTTTQKKTVAGRRLTSSARVGWSILFSFFILSLTERDWFPRFLPSFYRILPSFSLFEELSNCPTLSLGFKWVFTGFDRVLPSFTGFSLCFTGFYLVLLGYIGFLPSFTGLHWVLPSFTGLHWVLPSFTGFYLVLLGIA